MGTQETILVVEDDPDVRTLHRLWLADEYDVRTAKDGESAIAAVDEDVSVVLLDRTLPGLSGDAVTRRLRADGYDGVIALVTANPPDQALLELAFDDYLRKPISGAELRACVERSLSRLEMPPIARKLFALISLRKRLTETVDHASEGRKKAVRTLDNRIETHYQEAIDDGMSPRQLSGLALEGLHEDINLADSVPNQHHSLEVSAPASAGHEF